MHVTVISPMCRIQNFGRHVTCNTNMACRIDRNGSIPAGIREIPRIPEEAQMIPAEFPTEFYSHLYNSVNTENSFFGRDVTYLPQKDIFPHPDNADGSTLDKDILHLYPHYRTIWSYTLMVAWYFEEGLSRHQAHCSIRLVSNLRSQQSHAQSCERTG